jgi:hypothetical protein
LQSQPAQVTGGTPLVLQVLIGFAIACESIVTDLDFISEGKNINVTGLALGLA